MLFCKYRCLVAHEKCIFRKCFSVLTCLWCKMISVFILPSNTIFRKTERERERVCMSEIVPARKERERERERGRRESPLPATHELWLCRRPKDFAPRTQISVQLRRSTLTSNRTQISPFDFAGEPRGQDRTPSTSHPSTSPRWHWDSTDRTEFAIEKWLGFDEFDRIWWIFFGWVLFLRLSIEKWDYIFVWELRKCEKIWGRRRKCVFYIIFSNTTKH